MKIFYSDMELPKVFGKSIFLAGPTPRSSKIRSWRIDAISILDTMGYDGEVYIPERKSGWAGVDYMEQVEWEQKALDSVSTIVFWVPRDVDGGMPAFTTNVEFGMYVDGLRSVVYGRPDISERNGYLDFLYVKKYGSRPLSNLLGTMEVAIIESSKRDIGEGTESTMILNSRGYGSDDTPWNRTC